MNNFIIRNERPDDFRAVEEMTRKAFWNVNRPGCDEHYLVHIMRSHPDFIPELDFVAESKNGEIIGNVMYTKSKLVDENGTQETILTFGPLSVRPDHQRKGVGKALLEYSFPKAIEMGYKAIVIFGSPANYVARGFKACRKYNICAPSGRFPTAMMVKELVSDCFDGRRRVFHESPLFEFDGADAEKFDAGFEPMEKGFSPTQEEFYILSHSAFRE